MSEGRLEKNSTVGLRKFHFIIEYITVMFILTFIIVSFLEINHKTKNINIILDTNLSIKSQNTMQIKVNGKVFDVRLENNATSNEFLKRLPLHLNMKDLNSNEKFIYLETDLPSNPTDLKRINNGDILLYGDNCIVIFYKSFNTSYQYTKIGKIVNPEGLENVLGKGNVMVDFL